MNNGYRHDSMQNHVINNTLKTALMTIGQPWVCIIQYTATWFFRGNLAHSYCNQIQEILRKLDSKNQYLVQNCIAQ